MRVSVLGVAVLALAMPCAAAPSADAARSDALGKLPIILQPNAHDDLHNEFTAEATSTHIRPDPADQSEWRRRPRRRHA
jgi:hypothetical protein